jgi:S1-C subfamily serine protease
MGSLPPPSPVAPPVPPLPPLPPPTPSRRLPRRAFRFVVLVGVVAWIAGLTGAFLGNQLSEWMDRPPSRSSDQPLEIAEPRDVIQTRVDVAGVVDFVAPTVVTISADVNGGTSLGTGVIISSDGEILTNAHVIENASEIRVRLAGESEPRRVSLLAADRGNDLALLRMNGDGYEPATFADPGSVRIGDEVVAIGFALGLDGEPSVTLGIVSAVDRSIGQTDVFLDGLIQTDAAISSGNSGGPLVNAAGEVVGINTAVARDTATSSATNVSFAISVTEALPIVEALRAQADGTPRAEAYFGVGLEDRRDGGQGVIVTGVEPDTPADAAGVRAGDLIVAVDGSTTDGSAGLIAAIRDRQAGDNVTITIQRSDERRDLTVELTERPQD